MNRQKRLIITAGTVALLGLILLINPGKEQTASPPVMEEQTPEPDGSYLLDLASGEFQSLTLESPEGDLQLLQGDSGWYIESHESWELDLIKVRKLINEATHLYSEEQLKAESSDLSPWGLDQPRVRINITYKGGTKAFLLGASAPGAGGAYLMEAGSDTIHRISSTAAGVFQWRPEELRERTLLSFNINDFLRVILTGKDGSIQMEISPYERSDLFTADLFTYQITSPYPYPRPVKNERVKQELAKLEDSLEAEGFADSGNPKDYGLRSGGSRLTLQSTTGRQTVLQLGNRTSDGKVYVREEGKAQVYLVSEDRLPFLGTAAFDYLDPFPQLVSLPAVDRIRFDAPELSFEGKIDRSGENPIYRVKGQEISPDRFNEIYQTLIFMQLERERDLSRPRGERIYQIAFRLEGSTNNWTELNFYADGKDYLSFARNSEEPLFLLGRYQLEEITEELKTLLP